MKFIEYAKKIMDEQGCCSTQFFIYSRKEDRIVSVSTLEDVKNHSAVSIKPKIKDLFPGLK